MHLLDGTSISVLNELVLTANSFLIATAPTQEAARDSWGAPLHDTLSHQFLTPLSGHALDALLKEVFGKPFTQSSLTWLTRLTQGNPLYSREIILGSYLDGAIGQNGELWHFDEQVMATTPQLVDIIKSHMERATEHARDFIELLALCGEISLQDAQQYTSQAAIDLLIHTSIVVGVAHGLRQKLMFTHSLFGEIIRAGTPLLRQRQLLTRHISLVTSYGARRNDDSVNLARWSLTATGTADPALLKHAARLARHAHDYGAVVDLLRSLDAGSEDLESHVLLGESLMQMRSSDAAESSLRSALDQARSDADRVAVALSRTANFLWSNIPVSAALKCNYEAMEKLSDQSSRQLLEQNEGFILVASGRPAEGLRRLHLLPESPPTLDNIDSWLRNALMKSSALALTGQTANAMRWSRRALNARHALNHVSLVSHPIGQNLPSALAASEAGLLSQASAEARECYFNLPPSNFSVRGWASLFSARSLLLSGHIAEARRWFNESAAIGREREYFMVLRLALSGHAACASQMRDFHISEISLKELDSLPVIEPGFFSRAEEEIGRSWYLANRGYYSAARAILATAAEVARMDGHLSSEGLVLTELARIGGCREVADRLAAIASVSDSPLFVARANFVAALCAGQAETCEATAEELLSLDSRLLAAEMFSVAAGIWKSKRNSQKAAELSKRSLEVSDDVAKIRTPLLWSGLLPQPLTFREQEIAHLVARRLASKQIAEALHLSPRTVDNHLQKIFHKLDIDNRFQLSSLFGETL
ncbi:helix-turn-helix transcriptional regulator [Streptomyces djakartensis]|uniref:helix-turn-helix transcriptional regulator n=1 Tax=Streptomyces djakartensis TaxID=68193 RepID=UPI0034DF7649